MASERVHNSEIYLYLSMMVNLMHVEIVDC